ncbi:MAG: hypothetical protein ACI96M_000385 [Candidatus Azotimanducaceae bacterium]|jgi:hypothetical protein
MKTKKYIAEPDVKAQQGLPPGVIATESFTVESGEVIVGDPSGDEAESLGLLDDVECGQWFAGLREHPMGPPVISATCLLCFHSTEYMRGRPDGSERSASLASGLCGVVDVAHSQEACTVLKGGDDEKRRKDPAAPMHGVLALAMSRLKYTPVYVYRTAENRIVAIYLSFLACESELLPNNGW